MSHIGKSPITVPNNIQFQIRNEILYIRGPAGVSATPLLFNIKLIYFENKLYLICKETIITSKKKQFAFWGLLHKLICSIIKGVTRGFKEELNFVGVGYRPTIKSRKRKGKLKKEVLILKLGYSHIIHFPIKYGTFIYYLNRRQIYILGNNLTKTMQTVADIQTYRYPDVYKGKGILYKDQILRRKKGKKK